MWQDSSSTDTASGWIPPESAAPGVDLRRLVTGTVLNVHTRNSCYRVVVIDGPRGQVAITGGSWFPEETPARIDGCNGGGTSLKTCWIGTGLRLEIVRDDRLRVVTSPVRSIDVAAPSNN